jgi:predicted DsbA family dithiol-disulfide isomerase
VRIEKLKRNYDVVVNLVHFPLHPETPAEGVSLDVLFAGSKADERAARQVRMKGLMDAEGLPYGERTHTYNSRLAQELGKWADTQDGGFALHDAIYKAYFVDGKNVGDLETLVGLAQSVGLSADAARKVLTERSFKDSIDEDWTSSRQGGVTGVPTFSAGGYGVVGAQPYEVLEKLMAAVGAKRRPTA